MLFIYVVRASSNPDKVDCVVPYRVNDDFIFFGPCKKRLRERLRKDYLGTSPEVQMKEEVYIVGVNGNNRKRTRKIIWAGKINGLMTFETAYNKLVSSEFQEMRSHEYSPLHLKPIYSQQDQLLGYQHVSHEHEREDSWILDVVIRKDHPKAHVKGKRILLEPGVDRFQVFTRDCCVLCDNIFFANGVGVSITNEMLDLLKQAQPGKRIDRYALFGYQKNKNVEGLAGRFMEIEGVLAKALIDLIKSNRPQSETQNKPSPLKPCQC